MILSLRHRFLFVRARKVAGTSVEMALSALCGDEDVVPAMIAVDERTRQQMGGFSGNYSHSRAAEMAYANAVLDADLEQHGGLKPPPSTYSAHMAIADVVAESGQSLKGFHIVAIARNPYARVISMLHMRSHFDGYRNGHAMPIKPGNLSAELDHRRKKGGMPKLKNMAVYAGYQPHFLRYENLDADLSEFADMLGVKLPVLPHAKRGALSNSINPALIFSRDQLDWINDWRLLSFPSPLPLLLARSLRCLLRKMCRARTFVVLTAMAYAYFSSCARSTL